MHSSSPDTGTQVFKWAEASCPANMHVLGGGATVNNGGHRVNLTSTLPIAADQTSPDSWYATAMLAADASPNFNWNIETWRSARPG